MPDDNLQRQQFTNLSSFSERVIPEEFDLIECRLCASPKSGLVGVFSSTKTKGNITLGLSFAKDQITLKEVERFWAIFQERTHILQKSYQ